MQKKYEFKDYAVFDCGGIEIGLKTWGELEEPRGSLPSGNLNPTEPLGLYAQLLLN